MDGSDRLTSHIGQPWFSGWAVTSSWSWVLLFRGLLGVGWPDRRRSAGPHGSLPDLNNGRADRRGRLLLLLLSLLTLTLPLPLPHSIEARATGSQRLRERGDRTRRRGGSAEVRRKGLDLIMNFGPWFPLWPRSRHRASAGKKAEALPTKPGPPAPRTSAAVENYPQSDRWPRPHGPDRIILPTVWIAVSRGEDRADLMGNGPIQAQCFKRGRRLRADEDSGV